MNEDEIVFTLDKIMENPQLTNSKDFLDLCIKAEKSLKVTQAILKFLSLKLNSNLEKEALQAIQLLDETVNRCGPKFHSEVGKFKFLNELIKLISPMHQGNEVSSKVKEKTIELLYKWSQELKNEPKIFEAYQMLKRQGIVVLDPLESVQPQAASKQMDEEDINTLTHLPTAEKANNNNPWAAKDSPLNIPEFDIYPVWRKKLFDYGLNEKVINKLEESFKTGKLIFNDLDVRALDALKYFPPEGAVDVLDQFMESNLEHVYNKSAYLCSIMKTYKMRTNIPPPATAPQPFKGPEESKIKAILKRTRYTLDVTTGQRKYGGPPPNWEGPPPPNGCEIFVGKIPRDIYEDKLIPLFEKCGQIWDLRLIMDPLTGHNRGFAFITFTTREAAQKAVKQVDGEEIKKGKFLRVTASVPNIQLFVGNIPKSKGRSEIMEEFSKLTSGLKDVIVYSSPDDPKKKNRGFCFLEYDSHRSAAMAKRRLGMGRMRIWGCDIIVDWADPQEEPDQETMSKVKVLYVSNLAAHVTEEALKQMFEAYGKVERVKKLRDYAFVHFESRDDAMRAMEGLHHKDLGNDILMSVSLAKPALDSKKKEEMLRNRERRMMQTMQQRAMMMGILPPFVPPPPPPPMDRVGQSRSNSASGSNSRIFYNDHLMDGTEPHSTCSMDKFYYANSLPPPPPPPAQRRSRSASNKMLQERMPRPREARAAPGKYDGRRSFPGKNWSGKQDGQLRRPMAQRPVSKRKGGK